VLETWKIEGFRLPLSISPAVFRRIAPKLDQARLVWMPFQSMFPQPFPQLLAAGQR